MEPHTPDSEKSTFANTNEKDTQTRPSRTTSTKIRLANFFASPKESPGNIADFYFPFLTSGELRFSPHKQVIENLGIDATIISTAEAAARDLSIKDKFSVTADAFRLTRDLSPGLQRFGLGGSVDSPTAIRILIDPFNPNTPATIRDQFDRYVAHEVAHVARDQSGAQKFSPTLLTQLISEGLATQYERRWKGIVIDPPMATALSEEELQSQWEIAKHSLGTKLTPEEHRAWFLGEGDEHPVWTGYALGSAIAGSYIDNHPDQPMSQIITLPSRTILDGSKFGSLAA